MAKNRLSKLLSTTDVSGPAPASYKRTKEEEARERRYRAEDALRCITRADEIRRDGGLMRDVRTLAAEQARQLEKVRKGLASGRR